MYTDDQIQEKLSSSYSNLKDRHVEQKKVLQQLRKDYENLQKSYEILQKKYDTGIRIEEVRKINRLEADLLAVNNQMKSFKGSEKKWKNLWLQQTEKNKNLKAKLLQSEEQAKEKDHWVKKWLEQHQELCNLKEQLLQSDTSNA